jgi:DNA-binding response OmpR family regulator
MKSILVIEDEAPLVEALKYTLAGEGFEVDVAYDGAEGIKKFRQSTPDLVLLDLMLPEVDGLEVCRRIREQSSIPILILTAKDTDIDEVVGLELGADDYVTKPFHTRKLIARIKALLRRVEGGEEEKRRIEWGEIIMDVEKHQVSFRGEVLHLTPIEYRILEVLLRHPGKAIARDNHLDTDWGGDFYGSPKTLDVHIRHLREKLEDNPADPVYIETVHGVGYRLGSLEA